MVADDRLILREAELEPQMPHRAFPVERRGGEQQSVSVAAIQPAKAKKRSFDHVDLLDPVVLKRADRRLIDLLPADEDRHGGRATDAG